MSSKLCRVCGDKASSFNFNAISCESCKAFFRRHALKNKILRCPFSNNCHIDTITRRFCQKCRLQKCFTIGMDKNLILSEEQKLEKKRKIQKNRDKSNAMNKIIGNNSNIAFSEISSSTQDDSSSSLAVKTEFNPTALDDAWATLGSRKSESQNTAKLELNFKEKSRIDELFVASRFLEEPLDPRTSDPNDLISLINLTDLAVKRIIKMTRGINSFNTLCQEDQIALLKGGCSELMILKSIKNFDMDKNSWRLPTGSDGSKELNCDMNVLKQASSLGLKLYKEYHKFIHSFDPKWRTDESVVLLLSAIALFSPERPNIVHKKVVKLEQDTYFYLLRRYLEISYKGNTCDARSAFLDLIERLKELQRLNETHLQVYLEVDKNDMEPLLIEIFDLSPKIKQ